MSQKNLHDTYYYVIYHCGPAGKEHPFFAKGNQWEAKFTSNFHEALVLDNLLQAQAYADEMNKTASLELHCLAGKIKVGKIQVDEMVPVEI